jgi:hypothetical protein
MDRPTNNKVHCVEEWLTIATHGLVPPARERIKLEIEAHYADLITARLANGMTQQDAESSALLELGEPSTAARQFRKNHLTEEEKTCLENWVESSRKSIRSDWLVYFMFLPLVVVLFFWTFAAVQTPLPAAAWPTLGWFISCLVIFSIINIKVRRLFKQTLPAVEIARRLLTLQLWSALLQLMMLVTSIPILHPKGSEWLSSLLVVPGFTVWFLKMQYLFRTLRKHGASDSFALARK